MSFILPRPLTAQWLGYEEHGELRVATAEMQGMRPTMEDETCCTYKPPTSGGGGGGHSFFGVFDGHGGATVSAYLKKHLGNNISKACGTADDEIELLQDHEYLSRVAVNTDFELQLSSSTNAATAHLPPDRFTAGSTALWATVKHDDNKTGDDGYKVCVSNLGDCRALLITKGGKCIVVTRDHKPDLPDETKRIQAAGGFVTRQKFSKTRTIARVDGNLSVSRAFGDFHLKTSTILLPGEQKVSCVPEHYDCELQEGDTLLLACDGVFDEMSNDTIALFIETGISDMYGDDDDNNNTDRKTLDELASAILLMAVEEYKSTDNTSAIIIHRRRRRSLGGSASPSPSAAEQTLPLVRRTFKDVPPPRYLTNNDNFCGGGYVWKMALENFKKRK